MKFKSSPHSLLEDLTGLNRGDNSVSCRISTCICPSSCQKNLQKSSAIQNNSITLLSVIIAIIVRNSFFFSTIKIRQFSLITNFISIYNSSNSRYLLKTYHNIHPNIPHLRIAITVTILTPPDLYQALGNPALTSIEKTPARSDPYRRGEGRVFDSIISRYNGWMRLCNSLFPSR